MIKIFFKKKSFFKFLVCAFLCGLLMVSMHISSIEEYTAETAFLAGRDGYVDLADKEFSSEPITCSLWFVLFVPFISQIMLNDSEIAKNFVFIRLKDNGKWYDYKMCQGLVYSLFASTIYNVSIFLWVLIRGFEIQSPKTAVLYVAWGSVSGALFLFLLVVLAFVLSIKLPSHISTIIVLFFLVFTMIGMLFIYNDNILQYFLLTNYFISWHLVVSDNNAMYTHPTWCYYMALVMMIGIIYLIGRKAMKKSDSI